MSKEPISMRVNLPWGVSEAVVGRETAVCILSARAAIKMTGTDFMYVKEGGGGGYWKDSWLVPSFSSSTE